MSKEQDGGPAFPVTPDLMSPSSGGTTSITAYTPIHGGMTLRDYFAAKALQGTLASPNLLVDHQITEVCQDAYRYADAMLAQRSK